MSTPLHVVVGAGSVGTALAHRLIESGARVRLVTRSGSGPDHPAVERIAADAADGVRLTELAEGAAAIYNCANPAYHRWAQDWPPVAHALLTAAEHSGAVLATCSNLYGYGPTDAALGTPGMTEELPLVATGTKGRVRAQMWREALEAHRAGRVRVTEVRGSDYLGATAASTLGDLVVPRLLKGRGVWLLAEPEAPHTYTYTGDVARLLLTVATDERAWGRAWHVPSHPAVPARRVVDDLADLAGVRRVRVRRIPNPVLRAMGLVVPSLGELPEVLHQHIRPWHLDSSAARETFGLEPTPWAEILRAHLGQYRAERRAGGSVRAAA
jgi:nucleoside-diphosphate-sugar epimerase